MVAHVDHASALVRQGHACLLAVISVCICLHAHRHRPALILITQTVSRSQLSTCTRTHIDIKALVHAFKCAHTIAATLSRTPARACVHTLAYVSPFVQTYMHACTHTFYGYWHSILYRTQIHTKISIQLLHTRTRRRICAYTDVKSFLHMCTDSHVCT